MIRRFKQVVEPYWNVNDNKLISFRQKLTKINRTILECKILRNVTDKGRFKILIVSNWNIKIL